MFKFITPTLTGLLLAISFYSKAQCLPELLNCGGTTEYCDYSTNDVSIWNDPSFWDAVNTSHDLAESDPALELRLLDTCVENFHVRCLLFLDLNGDGVRETVIDSDHLPDAGKVNYNNAFNPNYSGGTPTAFDQRPVPANQKWQFVLPVSGSGDTLTYKLRWTSALNPGVDVPALIPYGQAKLRWEISDAGGLLDTCEQLIKVNDCKKPTVVCLNGLSVNIMPTQMIQLWASDFLQYTEDNATPSSQIKIAIRKAGTGSGFPVDSLGNPIVSVVFTCAELGTQTVELWAIDASGNAEYCETYIIVMDNLFNCGGPPTNIVVCAADACANTYDEVSFHFESPGQPGVPPFDYFDFGTCGSLPNFPLPLNSDVIISASYDADPGYGVTALDLVTIKNHIDGTDHFDNPYQWVAADANNDKVIDTLDIKACRELLLGIYTHVPYFWRFVDKSYVFPSPDPLSVPFPETITLNLLNPPQVDPEFVVVKICDLSCGNLVDFFDLQAGEQTLIGEASPNPASGSAYIPLQLAHSGPVKLDLMDAGGRLLFQVESLFPEGASLMEIPASAMPSAGLYFWKVTAGNAWHSGRLMHE